MDTPVTEFPEYASIAEITTRFGISRGTQYRLIADGKIEAVKVRAAVRIVTATVEKYFTSLPRMTGKSQ
ncbi:hypothetical protein CFR73_15060 [Novacetimonas maltaceti]|uniref:Helix-turn-helix domain-containing protein n=1 Tax=Novacetimonas maltaceti TaxID=1203393 RepID=A0A2S3VY34_9PROT|nr:excisionase family DNA-binding protein [Novacetimonas maltaceti]POF61203.1 hypothetical protein KMAL_31790 [Novacetimonas maltaceti]PYD58217.1 hypothetical protein CFR73_15060 [Novacetimonas maltaceti]